MRTCPSDLAIDAARGLEIFLDGRAGLQATPEHVGADWQGLWLELRAAGWLDVGTELASGSTDENQMVVDAAYVASAFAKYLISLPFVETLGRQVGQAIAERRAMTRLPVPLPTAFPAELYGADAVGTVDRFAPTLPTGTASVATVNVRELQVQATLRAMGAASCARQAFRGAVEYSKTRRAYGQPIGSFQGMKHLMADVFVAAELSESGCMWAANDLDNALAICTDVLARCQWIAGRCIQIYGGIGFSWEGGTHYYARHILAAEALNRRLAKALGTPDAA